MFSIIIKNVWSYFFSLIGSRVLERYRKKIFIGLQVFTDTKYTIMLIDLVQYTQKNWLEFRVFFSESL